MILINGYFLCRKLTGIERVAYELTNRLDNLCFSNEISIIIPGNCNNIPNYKNINIIKYKKIMPHIIWQHIYLQIFLFFNSKYTMLDYGNTCLPLFPGIIFLHDIYCKLFPKDFITYRDKIVRLYNLWQYKLIAHKAKHIITVSNYIKNQITQYYKIKPDKISVIYGSYDHFITINPDYTIINSLSFLSKPFYFTLGSLSRRKNLKWILQYAHHNPNSLFAISGISITTASDSFDISVPENVKFLGYLDDSKVKALMQKCKAFIHPAYYEGFGLTPLEALSCGARIIVSNVSSLPEIYGKSAIYIDPNNYNIDLDNLIFQKTESAEKLLKKYSYNNSSKLLYDLIKRY